MENARVHLSHGKYHYLYFFINIHFYGVELNFLDVEITMIILGVLEGLKIQDDYGVEVSFVSLH